MSIKGEMQGIELGLHDLCGVKDKHTHLTLQGIDKLLIHLKAEARKMENPYPEDVFPWTIEEAGKYLKEKIGENNTTAISGALCRLGFNNALDYFIKLLEE